MFSQIPDKDLEKRRCEQRVDPLTDVIYTKSEYAPEVPATDGKDKNDEEEEEEEEEAEEEMIEEEEEVSFDNNDEFHHALPILWEIAQLPPPTPTSSKNNGSSLTVLSVRPGSRWSSRRYSLANHWLCSCIFHSSSRCKQKGDTYFKSY